MIDGFEQKMICNDCLIVFIAIGDYGCLEKLDFAECPHCKSSNVSKMENEE
jgi:Zn finger protein HypA/HybF involved in hydrogenase expression